MMRHIENSFFRINKYKNPVFDVIKFSPDFSVDVFSSISVQKL